MSVPVISLDSARGVDTCEVERGLRLLVPAGETFEIRSIVVDRNFESIHSGYFTDPAIAARAVAKADTAGHVGSYVTLNPVKPSLLARRANRLGKAGKDGTTKDQHIVRRTRLLLDIDAARESGISASDAEHTAALTLATEIEAELAARGWPDPMRCDSGNGGHLIYAIDLPADDGGLVERVLAAAQAQWGCAVDGVTLKIDVSNKNPSRITKLYGTRARKGDSVGDRQHRQSRILKAPEALTVVARELLEGLAAEFTPATETKAKPTRSPVARTEGGARETLDVAGWLAKHGIEIRSTDPTWRAADGSPGTLHELAACPFNADHVRGEAHVIQFEGGGRSAGCHHESCTWDWKALREKFEPSTTVTYNGDRIVTRDWSALALAEIVLNAIGLDEHGRQRLARWAGQWWLYETGHHRALDDEAMRALVWAVLRRVDIDRPGNAKKGEPPRVIEALPVGSRIVSEVSDAGLALADRVPPAADLPYALAGYNGPSTDRIALVRNGLLELAAQRLHAPTPRVFATAGAAVNFDPDAKCPTFEKFLIDIFTDDEDGTDTETIRLVRQIFGWLIAGDTSRHVIPLLLGPPRSGKSTLANLIRLLLGEGNVCAPPLASLAESRFGLAPLLGKTLAIIPDARLGARADQAAVAGLLLAASGRDTISIDRKNRDAIEARLRCRIMIVTNELPRIADASGALASRWLVVETRRSFLGKEDLGLEAKLAAELSGILTWALDGWSDLQAKGWARPSRAADAIDELERLGSPIKAFIADRLVQIAGAETALEVLYREWVSWCESVGRKEPGSQESFARDLRSALPGVRSHRPRSGDRRITTYLGLGIGRLG
jgi:putative DNA primase/helicase